MDSFSLLYEVPLEIRNLIFSFTDEVTRFVLRFVNKDLREQYPFDCSDPAPELFYFAGFLIECIKKGYFKLLRWGVEGSASCPIVFSVVNTALSLGDEKSFEYLIEKGGKVHTDSIIEAVKGRNMKLIRAVDKMLEYRIFSTVLFRMLGEAACSTQDPSIVRWLIDSRYPRLNFTETDLSLHVAFANNKELVEFLSSKEGFNPWRGAFGAALKGHIDLFHWIVQRFNLDMATMTPALFSTWTGICQGGSLDLLRFAQSQCPSFGEHLPKLINQCVLQGNCELVEYLLGFGGVDVNQYRGVALFNSRFDVVKILIEHGALAESFILDYAGSRASEEFIDYLLDVKQCSLTFGFFLSVVQSSVLPEPRIKRYLERAVASNFPLSKGSNELIKKAAFAGKFEVVDYICSLPGVVVLDVNEILFSSVRTWSTVGVNWALERGAKSEQNLLTYAVTGRADEKMIELLISHGYQVDDVVLFKAAESVLSWRAMRLLHAQVPFNSDHVKLAARGKKMFNDLYWMIHHCLLLDGISRAELKKEALYIFFSQENRLFYH